MNANGHENYDSPDTEQRFVLVCRHALSQLCGVTLLTSLTEEAEALVIAHDDKAGTSVSAPEAGR